MLETIAWWRWLVLAVFFAALGFVWWWSRRGELQLLKSGKKEAARMKILERRYLGPKASLLLVEADGQTFLLALNGAAAAWQAIARSDTSPPKS